MDLLMVPVVLYGLIQRRNFQDVGGSSKGRLWRVVYMSYFTGFQQENTQEISFNTIV
jgi:hypothetical protein